MEISNIIRVRRATDEPDDDFVLIRTRQASPDSFALEIDGTEGREAYTCSCMTGLLPLLDSANYLAK